MASDYLREAQERLQAKDETRENSMASVNKVILVGNLGKDPELKYTQAGKAFCNFSIATTDTWNDAAGVKQEKTEWHRITVWAKQAENCGKYLKKGSSAYIEGRLQTRSWDHNGEKRYATEIVADSVKFLGGGTGQRAPANAPAEMSAPPQAYNYETGDFQEMPF